MANWYDFNQQHTLLAATNAKDQRVHCFMQQKTKWHTQKIHVAHDTPVIKCIYIDMWANKLFTKYTQWNIVNVCDLPIFNVWKYGISMSHLTILSLKHVASIAGETEIVFTQSLGLYSGCMQTNRQHTIFPQQRKTHRHIRTHTAQRIRGKE